VPVNDVPADGAVNVTVRDGDVFNVTVNVLPDRTASLVVAVTLTVSPVRYVPSAADEENDDTVGATPSTTIALAPAMLLAPVGTVVEVIALPAVSATVPIVKLDTVKSADVWLLATVYVPDSVVPADAAVSNTVAPVSSVAVSVLPD
jgi:hypothetical protein